MDETQRLLSGVLFMAHSIGLPNFCTLYRLPFRSVQN